MPPLSFKIWLSMHGPAAVSTLQLSPFGRKSNSIGNIPIDYGNIPLLFDKFPFPFLGLAWQRLKAILLPNLKVHRLLLFLADLPFPQQQVIESVQGTGFEEGLTLRGLVGWGVVQGHTLHFVPPFG